MGRDFTVLLNFFTFFLLNVCRSIEVCHALHLFRFGIVLRKVSIIVTRLCYQYFCRKKSSAEEELILNVDSNNEPDEQFMQDNLVIHSCPKINKASPDAVSQMTEILQAQCSEEPVFENTAGLNKYNAKKQRKVEFNLGKKPKAITTAVKTNTVKLPAYFSTAVESQKKAVSNLSSATSNTTEDNDFSFVITHVGQANRSSSTTPTSDKSSRLIKQSQKKKYDSETPTDSESVDTSYSEMTDESRDTETTVLSDDSETPLNLIIPSSQNIIESTSDHSSILIYSGKSNRPILKIATPLIDKQDIITFPVDKSLSHGLDQRDPVSVVHLKNLKSETPAKVLRHSTNDRTSSSSDNAGIPNVRKVGKAKNSISDQRYRMDADHTTYLKYPTDCEKPLFKTAKQNKKDKESQNNRLSQNDDFFAPQEQRLNPFMSTLSNSGKGLGAWKGSNFDRRNEPSYKRTDLAEKQASPNIKKPTIRVLYKDESMKYSLDPIKPQEYSKSIPLPSMYQYSVHKSTGNEGLWYRNFVIVDELETGVENSIEHADKQDSTSNKIRSKTSNQQNIVSDEGLSDQQSSIKQSSVDQFHKNVKVSQSDNLPSKSHLHENSFLKDNDGSSQITNLAASQQSPAKTTSTAPQPTAGNFIINDQNCFY